MRTISAEYCQLPQTYISVLLHDVYVEDIDESRTKQWLEANFLEQSVNIDVVQSHAATTVEGYLYPAGQEAHINDLIYVNFAVEETSTETTSTETTSTKTTSTKETSTKDNSIALSFSPPPVMVGVDELVEIVSVETSTTLKCQLLKYSDQLEELAESLADIPASMVIPENVSVDMCCLAMFSEDECWYRARITDILTPDQVNIQFVDYGNTDSVDRSNLRVLTSDLVSLPQAFITVTLHDVHSEDIDNGNTQEWLNIFVGQRATLDIVSVSYGTQVNAYVYQEGNTEHINDMIYENFVVEAIAKSQLEETPVVLPPGAENASSPPVESFSSKAGDVIIAIEESSEIISVVEADDVERDCSYKQ